jgi:hypothetical protein
MKPSAIYVWLVPSEEVQEQPGGWRIRKWDTEPFLKANFTLSETGMPGNGNTPTTREGSAAAPGKAGTEARQESLGDKHGLVDRACSYLQDLESPFSDEEAVTLCAMLRSHVATNGQHDDVIEGLRVIASRRGCKIQQGDVLALERAIDALHHVAQSGEAVTVADIEAEIAHIEENGQRVKELPGMFDEGRCRELCAMYLREFVLNLGAKKKLAALMPSATGSNDEIPGLKLALEHIAATKTVWTNGTSIPPETLLKFIESSLQALLTRRSESRRKA